MRSTATAGAASALLLVAFALTTGCEAPDGPATASPSAVTLSAEEASRAAHPSLLYGRVTTYDGATYEGRLRWGGSEEAFWGHYFNGVKDENRWKSHVPLERLTEERPTEIFGIELFRSERPLDLGRPFMVRFGDIARIEARGEGVRGVLEKGVEDGVEYDPDVRVTLKSGAVFDLDRLSAGDFDDGVRVWDGQRGVVDLAPRQIRSIEFLPSAPSGEAPDRLHGTVRTRQGAFTGFLQWNREEALGPDVLTGYSAGREVNLRFDDVGSIARRAPDSSLVTLLDGREIVLSGTAEAGRGHRGLYVDDPRYGRVLIPWDAFERVDFSPGGSGPTYDDFPPGHPLTGTVTARDGRRLTGRLVYDLDESETTETLDAPAGGVDYTIPFGLIATVVLPGPTEPARVTLQSGEELQLARAGDLGEGNAGVLVFSESRERPEYVPWTDIGRIDFDRPPAPPLGGR